MGLEFAKSRFQVLAKRRIWDGVIELDDYCEGQIKSVHGHAGRESDIRFWLFCLDGGAIIEGDAEFLCGEEVGFEDHVCFGRDAVVSLGVMHCSDDVCGDLPWSGGLVVSGLLGV